MENFSELPGDSLDWTVQMCLDEAKQDQEKEDFDACLVLFQRKTEDGGFHTRFLNCGLTTSEAVALIEIIKFDMIKKQRGD
jgi:hypothetical protein